MRDDRTYLLDVLETIERIERYTRLGRETFAGDELVQTWVVHHLEILGEACRGISDMLRSTHSDVSWSEIIGMRNMLVHHYFGIDVEKVWDTVVRDLPELKAAIETILRELPE